jgi:lipopolysaccharide heptosyltransferase II
VQIKKILIFNPFGIGDVLFTTPLIRNLKENLKDSSISYLCNRRVYPLLMNNVFLDKVFIFEKDEWRQTLSKSRLEFLKKALSFLKEIRREKFDIVFDLSLNSQYGFFLKIAGIKKRIGFNFRKRGRFLTEKIDIPFGYSDKHVTRYYLDLLKFLDIEPKEYKFDLFLSEKSLKKAEESLKSLGLNKNDLLIGVCPGSGDSWRDSAYFKRWPQDKFLNLCNLLQTDFGAKIILFGSGAETSLCDYIYNNLRQKPINLCGKVSLEEFSGIFSLCKLLITNDGGPFHVAQALGKAVIVFFGPVDEKVYGVYSDSVRSLVFTKDVSCRPCYREFKFRGCPFDKMCLREISLKEVYAAIKGFITSQRY